MPVKKVDFFTQKSNIMSEPSPYREIAKYNKLKLKIIRIILGELIIDMAKCLPQL